MCECVCVRYAFICSLCFFVSMRDGVRTNDIWKTDLQVCAVNDAGPV